MFKRILLAAGVVALAAAAGLAGMYFLHGELIRDRRGGRQAPSVVGQTAERIGRLKLPAGFRINVFATGLLNPRMLAVGEGGIVFVTRPRSGDVVALEDRDGDGVSDRQTVVFGGVYGVHGIAIGGGRMFLSSVRDLHVLELRGTDLPQARRLIGDLPAGGYHWQRGLGIGPDGRLYISIGSTCNACVERNAEHASIVRVGLDGSGRELFASGLRNTIGFAWHPTTGELWGMDNGSDWLGDDTPPEELNRLTAGAHYGWPFQYARNQDVAGIHVPIGADRDALRAKAVGSVLEYTAHAAPIQMAFYTGTSFPAEYRGDAFVAMHGSWNRRPASGYEVVRIRFRDGRPLGFEPFLTGFLVDEHTAFARPAGIAVARDGSLLVGDEANGVIYRVSYAGG